MCKIGIISAVRLDGCIGNKNKLMWKISEDLKFYKEKTLENVTIIGYNTYLSLPTKALKNRQYVVICDEIKHTNDDNIHFVNSTYSGMKLAKKLAEERNCDILIAGGGSIYRQMMEYCDYALITFVDIVDYKECDTTFPLPEFFSYFKLNYMDDEWKTTNGDVRYKFSKYIKK